MKNRDRSGKLKGRHVIGNIDEDKKEAKGLENRLPGTRHAANAIIGINVGRERKRKRERERERSWSSNLTVETRTGADSRRIGMDRGCTRVEPVDLPLFLRQRRDRGVF